MTLNIYAGALDFIQDSADAASYTSALAARTPIAGALLVAPIWTLEAAGANPPTVTPAPSSWGLTWESVYGPDAYDSTGTTVTLQVYAAIVGASPASGNFSYALSATSTSGEAYVSYLANVDTSGGTAASCFVQTSSVAQGTGTSGSQTLSAFASSRNVAYGAQLHIANEQSTAGAAFTMLQTNGNTSPAKGMATEWGVNQTTVDFSWSTSSDYGIWAAEIKALPVYYGQWFVP